MDATSAMRAGRAGGWRFATQGVGCDVVFVVVLFMPRRCAPPRARGRAKAGKDHCENAKVSRRSTILAQWGLLYAGQVRTAFCQDPLVQLTYGPVQYP